MILSEQIRTYLTHIFVITSFSHHPTSSYVHIYPQRETISAFSPSLTSLPPGPPVCPLFLYMMLYLLKRQKYSNKKKEKPFSVFHFHLPHTRVVDKSR